MDRLNNIIIYKIIKTIIDGQSDENYFNKYILYKRLYGIFSKIEDKKYNALFEQYYYNMIDYLYYCDNLYNYIFLDNRIIDLSNATINIIQKYNKRTKLKLNGVSFTNAKLRILLNNFNNNKKWISMLEPIGNSTYILIREYNLINTSSV